MVRPQLWPQNATRKTVHFGPIMASAVAAIACSASASMPKLNRPKLAAVRRNLATSAPGSSPSRPHLHRDFGSPHPHLPRDLGSSHPHLLRDLGSPRPHLLRDCGALSCGRSIRSTQRCAFDWPRVTLHACTFKMYLRCAGCPFVCMPLCVRCILQAA